MYFREYVIVGAEQFPATGPLVIVANHSNSLVDGAIVATLLPRMSRPLAASTVWDYRAVAPILNAAGVIPVYRQSETEKSTRRNRDSFSRAHDLLALGGILALFPEGISHNDPGIRPVKSGAARIALEAERQRGPLGIAIVPVGLNFEAKTRFRSRLLIRIGAPIDITALAETYRTGGIAERAQCVRTLSSQIQDALATETLSFDTWEEARLLSRAADLWASPEPTLPAKPLLEDAFLNRKAFLEGYLRLRQEQPDRIAALRTDLAAYDGMLTQHGLRDEQVAASYPAGATTGYALRAGAGLLLRLPQGAIATLLNIVPFSLATWIGRGNDPDKQASWSIFASLAVYPVYWSIQAATAAFAWTALSGKSGAALVFLAMLAAGPLIGRFALAFHDLQRQLAHQIRAWLFLRRNPDVRDNLRRQRQVVLNHLARLIDDGPPTTS